MDRSLGLRGYDDDRQFSSASVSKALLLAAELRRLESEGLPLDDETKALLEPMITYSDNRAADAIYARVGDEGLEEVAERAGMNDFDPTPGFWGGDRITAADMARFFYRLDRNLPGPHRAYAKRLLARITPVERWGIPEAVGHGWSIWFKGGWRPPGGEENSGQVTHQAGAPRPPPRRAGGTRRPHRRGSLGRRRLRGDRGSGSPAALNPAASPRRLADPLIKACESGFG